MPQGESDPSQSEHTRAGERHGRLSLTFVLWSGVLGGAETLAAALAATHRRRGVDASVLFISEPDPLAARLRRDGTPYESLGLRRGRELFRHFRRYARRATAMAEDGAIVMSPGFLASTLRAGGYRGRLVAVQHGELLRVPPLRLRAELALAVPAIDHLVAVSAYMRDVVLRHPHPKHVTLIPNGVDTNWFVPRETTGDPPVIGWAGRFVPGKGVDTLMLAMSLLRSRDAIVRIAGDGPERARLEALRDELGLGSRVQMAGRVNDMRTFWQEVDVGVVCSAEFTESFGLAAVEAASCGKPVVVTRNGGLVEVVRDGTTGLIVNRGRADELAEALATYLGNRRLRDTHGSAGRKFVQAQYSLARCADRYSALFESNP